jgi:hypothetical protein
MKSITAFLKELNGNAIFRYVPFNQYLLQSLINNRLYFGDPHFQNDPIDSNYKLEIAKFPLGKSPFSDDSDEEHTRRLLNVMINSTLKNDYGICCFSNKIKEVLLWSHYTVGSQGFCMLFDKEDLLSSLQAENNEMRIGNVQYKGLSLITPEMVNSKIVFDVDSVVFNKMRNWKYEAEVRILCNPRKTSSDKPIHSYRFSKTSLKSIIIGERMGKDNSETLKNILKLPGYEDVYLFKIFRNNLKPDILKFKLLRK